MIPKTAVPFDHIEAAKKKAKEKGWELLNMRMLSDNPKDHYLMVTRCKVKESEWAVHLYNSEINIFAEGSYTDESTISIERYWDKR